MSSLISGQVIPMRVALTDIYGIWIQRRALVENNTLLSVVMNLVLFATPKNGLNVLLVEDLTLKKKPLDGVIDWLKGGTLKLRNDL